MTSFHHWISWQGSYYLLHFVDGEIKTQKVKKLLAKGKKPGNPEARSTFLSTHFTERKHGYILQFAWESSDGGSLWQQVNRTMPIVCKELSGPNKIRLDLVVT